jgi:hypothetical protein
MKITRSKNSEPTYLLWVKVDVDKFGNPSGNVYMGIDRNWEGQKSRLEDDLGCSIIFEGTKSQCEKVRNSFKFD